MNINNIQYNIHLKPLLISSDAKASRCIAGVAGGGNYPCQLCYIQVFSVIYN